MLYNGIFRCHGNICYVTFIDVYFCTVHIIGPINVCTNFEISRYNIDEFIKYTNIVCFIWRHMTQKRYVVRHSDDTSDSYFHQEHFAITQKCLRLPVMTQRGFFNVFGDFDIYSTFYHTKFYHTKYAWSAGVSLWIRLHYDCVVRR